MGKVYMITIGTKSVNAFEIRSVEIIKNDVVYVKMMNQSESFTAKFDGRASARRAATAITDIINELNKDPRFY